MHVIQNGLTYIAAILMVVFGTLSAQAADAWHVESQSGDVWIAHDGATPVSLGGTTALPSGTKLTTGASGRVIIRRGDEAVVIAPNTSIVLAPESRKGLATTIIQSIGTILLSVDKKDHQHFEVETPYLAAVVKGTKFAVTVADGKSSVHVVQGAVEVLDFESGDVGMVRPGQTADVRSGSGLGLAVTGPGAAVPAKAQRTGRTPRVVAPASRAASPGTAASGAALSPTSTKVNIKAAMGVQRVDLPAATGGLVRQAVAGTAASGARNISAGTGRAIGEAARVNTGRANAGAASRLALGVSNAGGAKAASPASSRNGNGGGLALGASAGGGNGNGNGGGLALGASNGAGNSGGGLALGASAGAGNSSGNGAGLALGLGNGNAGGNGNGNGVGLALGLGNGNAGGNGNGNAGGNGNGNSKKAR